MRKFTVITLSFLIFTGVIFAQDNINLSEFASVKALESEFEDFNNGVYAGLSALDWTDGSGPSLFRISAGVFMGFGSISKNKLIGLSEDLFMPAGAGLQVGFGTAGFEAYARYSPEFELSGVNQAMLGFGIKYEISDLIPVVGFPSTALFADYNTLDFGVSKTKEVTVDNVTGDVKTGVDLAFSSINIGAIMSYDFVVLRVYGKLAVELGDTELTWNQAVAVANAIQATEQTGNVDSTGFRYALGLVLFGFKAEAGGRGSNLFAAIGYGISI